MMILPLIISSLIAGLAQLDAKQSGRMGSIALLYYFATTTIAVITGIILVLTIHPGDPAIKQNLGMETGGKNVSTVDTFLDLIRNMFPDNIVRATFGQVQTKYIKVRPKVVLANASYLAEVQAGLHDLEKPIVEYSDGMNVLGIITFCIAVGIVLSQLGHEGVRVVEFFATMDKVIMRLVMYIMHYSPIGIMCLIMGKILEIADLVDTAKMLALYMFTVLCGLAIHALITLPLIYFVLTKKNPFLFMRGMLDAWITA
uniref:Amino acid transporter n=1 Tax=Acrobeloides nanus TaxID=290746 RepID=A0A914CTA5_9BILA